MTIVMTFEKLCIRLYTQSPSLSLSDRYSACGPRRNHGWCYYAAANSQKDNCLLNLLCTMTIELTFEKLCIRPHGESLSLSLLDSLAHTSCSVLQCVAVCCSVLQCTLTKSVESPQKIWMMLLCGKFKRQKYRALLWKWADFWEILRQIEWV